MSKQTFRKNLNSRTTKMKAIDGNSFSVVVTSVQKIDKSTRIRFWQSINDNIIMVIFPRDTDTNTKTFMSTNWSDITEIQISETLYKIASFRFTTLNYTLRFEVSNPEIINNGSGYSFEVNKKVYTNIKDGLTKQGTGWLLASDYFNNDKATWKEYTDDEDDYRIVEAILMSNDFTLYLSNGNSFNKTSS